MQMRFNDTAVLFAIRKNGYGKDVPQSGTEVPAAYEQVIERIHGDHQDAVTAESRLFLPAGHDFLVSRAYRIEGMIAQVNPFGYSGSEQYFRITGVTPIRDTLLCNEVRHVECSLEKLEDFYVGAVS